MASAFTHHFVSAGPKLAQSLPVKEPLKTDQCSHQSKFFFTTNENESRKLIRQPKTNIHLLQEILVLQCPKVMQGTLLFSLQSLLTIPLNLKCILTC